MEFAAYFVISAEGISMNMTRKLLRRNGLYNLVINFLARSESTPTTTRSGLIKSLIALPSFKNSGLEATSNGISTPLLPNSSEIAIRTFCAVPTGTVLFVTTNTYFCRLRPMVCAT